MKITKIPGLGRFGHFIDDLDFSSLSYEEWMEIGQLHMNGLVTIIRNVNLSLDDYEHRIFDWGTSRHLTSYRVQKKYNVSDAVELIGKTSINGVPIDQPDLEWLANGPRLLASSDVGRNTGITRVTGKRDKDGNPMGLFAEGELLWHSNESANLVFTPGVSLLGGSGVVGSSTGFLTTPDWYEEQSESFRSELDEIILEHKFTPGRINPGLHQAQDELLHLNMCPADTELPLIIKSPMGIKGLHYSVNTIHKVKGMTYEDSQKFFAHIDKTLFVEKYTYDHWYQQDNDLLLFDNSITLHRRLGGVANRLCYRIQFDYGRIAPKDWNPYYQKDYADRYSTELAEINEVLNIKY